MAIEIKYAVNMALQYNNVNEFDIEDYLLADNESGKLFLTESPTLRVLNEAEKSALYFLIDDSLFNASAFYEMYDLSGAKIDESLLDLGYDHLIHNAIPVNLNAFYVDPLVSRMDVSIINNRELATNGNFSEGAGDLFTGWSLTPGTGTITQSVAGGLNATRAVQMTNDAFILQSSLFTIGQTYKVSLWAKKTAGTSPQLQVNSNTTLLGVINLTDDYVRHEFTFLASGSDSALAISSLTSGATVLVDQVSIRLNTINYLTEIKSYKIDRDCYSDAIQINWLNKPGGRDTFVFASKPNIETVVERNNLIELSKLSNFESPKRIYGYREHISRKVYHLAHECSSRTTAEWLKRELIDSIDVMIVINGYYYPVMVLNSSIEENQASSDYTVSFDFRLAFDNNIQTR
jgi:hypothetical protein